LRNDIEKRFRIPAYWHLWTKGRTQDQAAVKANRKSRKTAAKYERLGLLPRQLKKPRAYRNRPDVFAEDWLQIEKNKPFFLYSKENLRGMLIPILHNHKLGRKKWISTLVW
jgi:hypothetical protein